MLASHWGRWQDNLRESLFEVTQGESPKDSCVMILRIPDYSNSQKQRVEECLPGFRGERDGEMLDRGSKIEVMQDDESRDQMHRCDDQH